MKRKTELAIVGGGCAGMAAALAAKEKGINDIIIIERSAMGGVLHQCIHNGFGLHTFGEDLTGTEFAHKYMNLVNEAGIECMTNTIVLSIGKDNVLTAMSEGNFYEIEAKAIIMATGCRERSRGALAIPGTRPAGVITAGTAQRYMNVEGYLVGKKVVILGSGDIGLIMARRMTLEGAKVLGVAELMPYSAGLNRNIVQCLKDFDIPLYLSHTVKQVIGKSHLEKVVIAKVDEKMQFIPGTEMEFDCDCLLLSVGLLPNVDLFNKLPLSISKTRGAKVNQAMETEIEGIFSAGNVLHVHDLVDYVVEEAREAASGAVSYLRGELSHKGHIYDVNPGVGINYVVPQKVFIDDVKDSCSFKFRVSKPMKDINIIITEGNNIIKKIFKPAIVPSEMEIVHVSKESFKKENSEIKIYVEERK